MGQTKKLFESMMQGMMEGISIEQQMTKRMVDDEYRMSIYKKEKETEEEDVIGSFDENGDLI